MELPDLPSSDLSDGSYPRLQWISNVVTLLVAVAAIGLSVWQGYETRKHNRLSVLPNVELAGGQLQSEEDEEYTANFE